MKKHIIFAAFAAVLALTSCEKDVFEVKEDNAYPVFTATINVDDNKTTLDIPSGKVSWELNDEITVKDEDKKKTATYKVASIDASGKATFIPKGTPSSNFGKGKKFSATYGIAPETVQRYSETVGKIYMKAPKVTYTEVPTSINFNFTINCGLMKINLTKAGESVKKIEVSGTPSGKTETKYTLNCETAQSIASGKDFFISLPAGTYNMIEITNASGLTCKMKATSGVSVQANHIRPVTIESSKINFVTDPITLSGKFTIDDKGNQVQFSRGNLRYVVATSNWEFYEHQYDCAPGYQTDTVSLFTWGYNAVESIKPDGNLSTNVSVTKDGATLSQSEDWGCTIGDGNTWRTLTGAEWQYILSRSGKFKTGVTVAGRSGCYVIAPDNFTGTLKDSYNAAEWVNAEVNEGLVCLPSNGIRQGNKMLGGYENLVCYWTTTCLSGDKAQDVYGGSVDEGFRNLGGAVRLVRIAVTE